MRINIIWNLLSVVLPALSALVLIPEIISNLSSELFGLLSIIWSFVAFGMMLDFGLGKSITYNLSKSKQQSSRNEIISSGIIISICICVFLIVFIPVLSDSYLRSIDIRLEFYDRVISSILLGVILCIQVGISFFRGVSESELDFKKISLIRMLVGVITYLGPWLASVYTDKLYIIILPIFFVRLIGLFFYSKNHLLHVLKNERSLNKSIVLDILSFGGWLSVSNILVMIMMQSDRILVGYHLSPNEVTTYAIPYELTIKLMIIVGAIASVIFPLLVRNINKDIKKANFIFFKSLLLSVFILIAPIISIYIWGGGILEFWLKSEVEILSVDIAQVLVIGVLINIFSSLFFTYSQAAGYIKYISIYQFIQMPIYIMMIIFTIDNYGIVGVAYSWVARVIIDVVYYFILFLIFNSKRSLGNVYTS
ncbi:oligosaccharide flippase family protein [Vibrio coralliirubri]|uniref:oligosaccharide flippase family protein n=1 Tax=Vibrio coralliirubri TaxID=1516159 RepID=UPI0006369898|nr:oligosaccharide flippase family protein [Vibrio coralliirubri]CDT49838.1 putative Polysaccharide biosynthesis protein [Vibrio coralliirubri]